jgi:DNA processing protein
MTRTFAARARRTCPVDRSHLCWGREPPPADECAPMPSPDREKLRTVALVWGASLGPAGFRRLTQRFGDTRGLLAAPAAELRDPALRLSAEQAANIAGITAQLDDYQQQLSELQGLHIHVLCPWEAGYPPLVAQLPDAPPVLCMVGRLLPEDDPAVAIVGTRTPTPEGLAVSHALGLAMAQQGTAVISGLARGCDGAAHRGALEGGGRTVAVVGCGLLALHPRENLDLARLIAERGAVLSETAPTASPTVGRLMARNRLTSALARGVIVVQARAQGGALETARKARSQGRLVWALRWPSGLPEAAGTQSLLAEFAAPLAGPAQAPDVRLALADHITRLRTAPPPPPRQPPLFEP